MCMFSPHAKWLYITYIGAKPRWTKDREQKSGITLQWVRFSGSVCAARFLRLVSWNTMTTLQPPRRNWMSVDLGEDRSFVLTLINGGMVLKCSGGMVIPIHGPPGPSTPACWRGQRGALPHDWELQSANGDGKWDVPRSHLGGLRRGGALPRWVV